jgi:hypothetical protein
VKIITGSYLESLLWYDPDEGTWTWINPGKHNMRYAGKPAGNRDKDGYLKIRIDGQLYIASHLACLWMTGKWPDVGMDHKDRDPTNDHWSNLREATRSQNLYNRDFGALQGIHRSGTKWWAMVGRNGYLGMFDNLEDAIIARDATAYKIAGDFAVLNSVKEHT